MDLTFLAAANGQPLTKTFAKPQKNGEIIITPYPHISRFTSHTESVHSDLESFAAAVLAHAEQGHCLLKGEIQKALVNESRAGSTAPDAPTDWIVFDFDGVQGLDIDTFFGDIGLSGVSYVLQYSASSGITSDLDATLSAHAFMLLDAPVNPALLKRWLTHINITHPTLSEQLTLTRSYNAMRFPLDITVNQNDKLVFIADPVLQDGLLSPFDEDNPRTFIVERDNEHVPTALIEDTPAQPVVDRARRAKLNELREAMGLPSRKNTRDEKSYKGVTVGASPTQAEVTGIKEERGFVYLNLNGGDSWAYYFPRANPEILKNFKGEQNYALKDIAPEVYKEYKAKAAEYILQQQQRELTAKQDKGQGTTYLAFLDINTDTYYRGTYDHATDTLDIAPTSSLVKLQHFLKQHGQPVPDFIPEWNYEFRFDSDVQIDPAERFVNRYNPSPYIKNPVPGEFNTILRIITHALGDDVAAVRYFLNWLAFVLQYRRPARTAWLMHGIQGTGKGVLFERIIAPLVGPDYVQVKRLDELEMDHNGYMEHCLFLLVDEVQISDAKHASRAMAKLKNLIPNPTVSIRAMRRDAYMAKNWINFVFASNKPDPVELDVTDRRFNVAAYQATKLFLEEEDFTAINDELAHFAHYLLNCEVNPDQAQIPMDSEAKRHIQYLTRNSIDLLSDALGCSSASTEPDGDLQYFFEALPNSTTSADLEASGFSTRSTYYEQLVERFVQDATAGRTTTLPRDDLRFIAEYLIGRGVPQAPNKFTAYVKHHGIDIHPVKYNKRTVQGIRVRFHLTPELKKQWSEYTQAAKLPATASVPPAKSKKGKEETKT